MAMKKFGYHQINFDHTLFLKREKVKEICLLIYVDDMIMTGNDPTETEKHKKKLF